jgi:hypothetical protein
VIFSGVKGTMVPLRFLIETNKAIPSQVTDLWCFRQGRGIPHRIGGRQELFNYSGEMYTFA